MPTISSTIRKVEQFTKLPAGWHFGDGVPSSPENHRTARILLAKAEELGFQNADAFPGINGEIQIVVYHDNDDYEFTVEVNGTITFAHDRDEQDLTYQEGLSLREALEALENLGDQAWFSSDSFTTFTMIETDTDLEAWLSRTPVTDQVYQFSMANVLSKPAGQFANISPDFTPLLLGSLSSIGPYLTVSSLPNASSSREIVSQAINAITTFGTGKRRPLSGDLKLYV